MKKRKVLIVGDHPLVSSLIHQYEALGCVVNWQREDIPETIDLQGATELFLLPNGHETESAATSALGTLLGVLSEQLEVPNDPAHKLLCHLMVNSRQTLQVLQTHDWGEAIRQRVDIYPFTMDEVWSRAVEVDYEPITLQSDKHLHLVIFGMCEMGELVAIHAAHVAHFPNYVRDHTLRTRITFIDEQAGEKSKEFIGRYQHLFDNSYYRVVRPDEVKAVQIFHHPMYEEQREDFVDVEWEFVEASAYEEHLREKLQLWASDDHQLLTLVMAEEDAERNLCDALHLPDVLHQNGIPVYLYTHTNIPPGAFPHIRPFGMLDGGYDVTLPYVKMAKNVNFIYHQCYAENIENETGALRYAVEIDRDERERLWQNLTNVKRMSNIYNAMTIPVKMRSMGLEKDDWEQFYDISQQDLEILGQVEHNRWSVEELILGWRPCTEEEQTLVETNIEKKEELKRRMIHYDLRAYNDLRVDKTGKSVKIYDLCLTSCLPLIAKTFTDEEGGEV